MTEPLTRFSHRRVFTTLVYVLEEMILELRISLYLSKLSMYENIVRRIRSKMDDDL